MEVLIEQADVLPGMIQIPRKLLTELLQDGASPLHLRMLLSRALEEETPDGLLAIVAPGPPRHALAALEPDPVALICAHLTSHEILELRTASSDELRWAMQRPMDTESGVLELDTRIRVRLLLKQIADLTGGTTDETIFESQAKCFYDDAEKRRRDTEWQSTGERLVQEQRAFEAAVRRRMAEQEEQTRVLIQERLREQLQERVAAELARTRAALELRIVEEIGGVIMQRVQKVVMEIRELGEVLVRDLAEQVGELRKVAGTRASIHKWICLLSMLDLLPGLRDRDEDELSCSCESQESEESRDSRASSFYSLPDLEQDEVAESEACELRATPLSAFCLLQDAGSKTAGKLERVPDMLRNMVQWICGS